MISNKAGKRKTFKTKRRQSKKLPLAIGLLAIIIVVVAAIYMFSTNNQPSGNKVLLKTSMGDITIQLRDDKPVTTGNFKSLVQQGFYDGVIFHRVIAGFMIQGGFNSHVQVATIVDEIGMENHNYRGTIAMAKTSQPNSATSQFFINVVNNNEKVYQDGTKFDETYTVFGAVVSGMDVVDDISNVETDSGDKPIADVTIIKAEIVS